MNEQTLAPTPVVVTSRQKSNLPLILVILLLLLLLPLSYLFSRWLLDECIKKIPSTSTTTVLGITNLAVDAEADQAEGGEVITFNITGDNTGPLSDGTVTFNTIGMGTIQSAPTGSGICVLTSSTQATCTGVSLLDNEQLNFAVPVVVDAACGLIEGDEVGVDVTVDDQTPENTQDANASGEVSCVTTAGSSSSSSSSGGSSSSSGQSSLGGAEANTDDSTTVTSEYDAAVNACYAYANNGFLIAAGLSLLLILIVFLVTAWGTRRQY
jgi:hypothetical protein